MPSIFEICSQQLLEVDVEDLREGRPGLHRRRQLPLWPPHRSRARARVDSARSW